jgi:tRNA A-37 threonylcarbamoyl transferase component Bud32
MPSLALSCRDRRGLKRQNTRRTGARRVSPIEIDGAPAWLKDFDQPSPPKWAGLQRAAHAVARLDLLKPAPTLAGPAGAAAEAGAIRRCREAGARVPEILWIKGARLALSDIGETLRDMQRRGAPAIADATMAAAGELARLHRHGIVHGRPILRNMTWNGARVGFLDFEERPLEVMPIESAAARDVLLLLMSVGRRSGQELVDRAWRTYAGAMRPDVARVLCRAASLGRPIAGPLGDLLRRTGNRDAAGLVLALRALRRHPPPLPLRGSRFR